MAEEQKKRHTYEINMVLERICQQNNNIVPSRIELFTEIFYPIAVLEIEMEETTFEDFDIVPLSVLKMIRAGVRTEQEIAKMMGLGKSYVQKVIDLLMGYEYIDANGLTELGAEALKIEKKVARSSVKQRFQADAVTGDLLKLGEQSSDADLQGRENTFKVTPHLPHIEGISVEAINRQLAEDDLTRYKRYQGGILNANVDTVSDVACIGLEYVKAYLMKLQGISSPFIFFYQYDSAQKEFNERFRWRPMRIPCEKAYTEFGFSREIERYSDDSLIIINELYRLICKSNVVMDEKKLKKLLERTQPFDYSTMDISMGKVRDGVPGQIGIYLNANSFLKWTAFVLLFLEKYDSIYGFLYTSSWLNGSSIRFESQSPDIKKASKLYKKLLRHEDRKRLNTYIRDRLFRSSEEKKAIDFKVFINLLEQYAAEDKEQEQAGE